VNFKIINTIKDWTEKHWEVEDKPQSRQSAKLFVGVVGIGTPPTPHPQACVLAPPLVTGGGAHSLARDGVGESQFRRGDI
jgi:hypothetical protein